MRVEVPNPERLFKIEMFATVRIPTALMQPPDITTNQAQINALAPSFTRVTVRRVWVSCSGAYPYQHLFGQALRNLRY